MSEMKAINAERYVSMLFSAADALEAKKEEINRMNVFPVPDGDTGSNMSMTIGGIRKLRESDLSTVGTAAKAAAALMLRSARGNSGVILSVFFRGFASMLEVSDEITASDFATALEKGTEAAYGAVASPKEGTVLTVMRESAEAARAKVDAEPDITPAELLSVVIDAASESLRKTPELLPMLASAGVVDAGGCGFLTVLSGMAKALELDLSLSEDFFSEGNVASMTDSVAAAASAEYDGEFTYCTECIIERGDKKGEDDALAEFLGGLGDSLVFVPDESIIKIHVHTNDPGVVLSKALEYGSLETVKIENMRLQHTALSGEPEKKSFAKKYGVVTVASGDGIVGLFRELGADSVVSGGQTMNPSTEDLLSEITAIGAETVFVLPNNKNIILAANEAGKLAAEDGITVIIIPTRHVTEGISALCVFDTDHDAESNRAAMDKMIGNVRTFSLTNAVRDAVIDGVEVKEGQYIGLDDGKLIGSADSMSDVISALAETVDADATITVLLGEDADSAVTPMLEERFAHVRGGVTVVDGGQPVYPVIISIE